MSDTATNLRLWANWVLLLPSHAPPMLYQAQSVSDGLKEAADKIERLQRERDGERAARENADRCLREKCAAMDVLFDRLRQHVIDYSDLLP